MGTSPDSFPVVTYLVVQYIHVARLPVIPAKVGIHSCTSDCHSQKEIPDRIKILMGIGDSLVGRLLLYDGLHMSLDLIKLRKSQKCPVCGESPTLTELIEYD
ncbi:MAG: hypothetical protein JXB30_07525 [Anaerolineae bacterium]|nr:hypothetical protein [Anaerolineae bacterium]